VAASPLATERADPLNGRRGDTGARNRAKCLE